MNILFLADPMSVHDMKWMSFFAQTNNCYLLGRESHIRAYEKETFDGQVIKRIRVLGAVEDFSTAFFWKNLRGIKKIADAIETYGIDIFHIMYAEPNVLWVNFRNRLKCPIVLTTRGTDILKTIPEAFTKKDLLNYFVSKLYRRAMIKVDFITCTSNQQISNIERLIGRREAMSVIRTGIEIDEIRKDTTLNLPEELRGKKFILFPRHMRPIYNHELSLQAIRLLPQEILDSFTMVFLDKDNQGEKYVVNIEERMESNQKANFCFLTRQSQQSFWELIKKARLVVMNPYSDGVPVSALEAMVCGTPLLLGTAKYDADVFADIPRILENNPQELASKMENLLNNDCSSHQHPIIDRKFEMQKLLSIYHDLQMATKSYER